MKRLVMFIILLSGIAVMADYPGFITIITDRGSEYRYDHVGEGNYSPEFSDNVINVFKKKAVYFKLVVSELRFEPDQLIYTKITDDEITCLIGSSVKNFLVRNIPPVKISPHKITIREYKRVDIDIDSYAYFFHEENVRYILYGQRGLDFFKSNL
jgi:hypothetical protein